MGCTHRVRAYLQAQGEQSSKKGDGMLDIEVDPSLHDLFRAVEVEIPRAS